MCFEKKSIFVEKSNEMEKKSWGGARQGAGRKAIGTARRVIKLTPEAEAYVEGVSGLSAYLSALIIADNSDNPRAEIVALAEKIKLLAEKI